MANLYVILLPQMDEHRNLGYMIKIGYSKSLEESRMKYGYNRYHRTVEVLHLYEGDFTLDDEMKLKQYFKDYVLFGREYLKYCQEVLDFFKTYDTTEKLKNKLSTLTIVCNIRYPVCPWLVDYIIKFCYSNSDGVSRQNKRGEIVESLRYSRPNKQVENACSIYGIKKEDVVNYINSKANIKDINNKIKILAEEFLNITETVKRLMFIVDFKKRGLTEDELIEFFQLIPDKYKEYYDFLGFEGIRACKYQETYIKRRIECFCINIQRIDLVRKEIYRLFIVGYRYSKSDIKSTLKNAYERVGYQKTAKASDLEEYFIVKDTKLQDDTKKWVNGFEIIGKK